MPATVVEAQKQIVDAIWAFADYPRLEASVKTKCDDFEPAQEVWKQKTAAIVITMTHLK